MKRSPLRRISKKQQERLRIYSKLREEYLSEHSTCEMPQCQRRSVDIHHTKKPRATYLNAVETWMGLCRVCHSRIENNKDWARENGYLENI